jgi:ribosomal protein S18 acetylase RimI-like enzyme
MVEFRKIEEASDPALVLVEESYTKSFPLGERRDFSLLKDLLSCETRFTLYALSHENQHIGFLSFWQFDAFAYIEHFAIDQAVRNKGWGGTVLRRFAEKINPIVLETEPPVDEWSTRRLAFYERLGFVPLQRPYLQPPYREGEPWIPLRLMVYGSLPIECRFEQLKQTIYQYVYKRK